MAVNTKCPMFAGMSSQFMFPSEQCSPGDPGAIAPPPAALVTIQPDKDGGYSGAGGGVTPTNPATRVVSVSVQDSGQVRIIEVSSHYSLRIQILRIQRANYCPYLSFPPYVILPYG